MQLLWQVLPSLLLLQVSWNQDVVGAVFRHKNEANSLRMEKQQDGQNWAHHIIDPPLWYLYFSVFCFNNIGTILNKAIIVQTLQMILSPYIGT